MKVKIILNLLIIVLLASCSGGKKGATSVKFYVLDSVPSTVNADANRHVQLNRVKLSDYLNQSSLLMRTEDQQFLVANYHSWAENLDEAVRRVLSEEMAKVDAQLLVLASCQQCPMVNVEINHFYPTSTGKAVLSGVYSISGLHSEQQQQHSPFSFQTELQSDGYEHAVKKMRELLLKLADSIVQDLNS